MATLPTPLAIVTAVVLGASVAVLVNTPAPANPSPADSGALDGLTTIGI